MLILIAGASTVLTFSSRAGAAAKGKLTLAWHAGFASRWLDPQEHDGTATPDNFFTAIHDALIKNQGTQLFDHPALAERFTIAPDSKSATFTLRKGPKFHNGDPVTPQDVKFSYENYRGSKADVFKKKTERVEIVDDRTVRFVFKEPFLDFAILFGTANVAGPAWVVPEKYYKQVGPDAFKQKPVGAGPYKLVRHEPGVKVEMEAFDGYYRPVNVKQLVMISVPEAATRVAMLERGEADIIYNVPGELINKVGKLPGVTLAPVLSGSFFVEFPGFQDPKNPFRDKRVREAISKAIDRDAIVARIMGGVAVAAGEMLPPGMFGANHDAKAPKADPDGAKKLLASAGYPNGFALVLATPNDRYINDALIAQAVAQMLTRVGLKVSLDAMTQSTFFAKRNRREFGFWLAGWGSDSGEMSSPLRSLLATPSK
ncbi:MAG: hypothetical protein DMD75_05820, partial [Candidatus Rokuibacteriota bacterium]